MVVKNVADFLNWSSIEVGKHEDDQFSISTWHEYDDLGIKSPIEQMLYTALKAFAVFNGIDLENFTEGYGNQIQPQVTIGKYRTDFIVYNWMKNAGLNSKVVVECDGHKFHDKDEKQRRYEKQRDRHLQKKGFKVIHFTGAEITQKPMECAKEVWCAVMRWDEESEFLMMDSNQ